MKDNGYGTCLPNIGYKVKIPSIFINYKMGQKLKALLSQSNIQINLRINFENIKSEKAEVVVYMQSRIFYNKLSQQAVILLCTTIQTLLQLDQESYKL